MVNTALLVSGAVAILVWGVASLILRAAGNRDMFVLFSLALLVLLFNSFALMTVIEGLFFPGFFGAGALVTFLLTLVGVGIVFLLQFFGSFILDEAVTGVRHSRRVRKARKNAHTTDKNRHGRKLPKPSKPQFSTLSFGRWEFSGLKKEVEETQDERE